MDRLRVTAGRIGLGYLLLRPADSHRGPLDGRELLEADEDGIAEALVDSSPASMSEASWDS
jgi:hypothetical protein